MKIKIARVGVFVAGFVMILSAGMVTAEIPYYEGKTITVLVQSRVGGGTDTTARMIAAHLPKYIPGKPRIVLRNMPGGGGSIANNIFYERGNLDGLHLLMSGSSAVSMQLRERDIVKYNLMDLNPIGHISRGGNVLMVRKEAFPRLTDPSAAPVVIGTKEGEETWLAMTIWGAEFLGWNLRYIPGYAGSSDFAIAFQRGEIDMMGTSNAYLIEQRRNEGSVVLVTQMGTYGAEGNFLRRAD
ncbi:MAG: hypothetical protein U1D99_00050, partial [Candidatus Omnitrophota bacterium]|nr:hypothetical protein [Candidatus Omnitrophota bacterium]